jgi:four helix bundle protein
MPDLHHAMSYRDLIVYQKARLVAQTVFQYSKGFPREEAYSLTDQIRRASRSIGAQIAEAWGKRQYEKYFVSKLTDADAEQLETQHWIDVAFDCGYINEEQRSVVLTNLSEIGKMLNAMIAKAGQFCGTLNADR